MDLRRLCSFFWLRTARYVRYMWLFHLPFSQALLYFLDVVLTTVTWRTTVEGSIDLEPGQGAVFVANHKSSIDPLYLQRLIPRPIHYLIAREYVESTNSTAHPARGGCNPRKPWRNRHGGRQAGHWLARSGEMVGLFPEGRINTTDDFCAPRPGAALVGTRRVGDSLLHRRKSLRRPHPEALRYARTLCECGSASRST